MKKFLLAGVMLLSACAGTGFQGLEQQSKDEVLIYYYRPWKYVGAALSLDISENNTPVTSLGVKDYYVHRTTAGRKVVSTKTANESDELPFNTENGNSYFVKAEREFCFTGLMGCAELNLVPQEKALKEIQNCSKVTE